MTRVLTGTTQAIRLKGRSFLAIVLSPELPLGDWLERFDALASRSAGYFLKRPVMLDVTGMDGWQNQTVGDYAMPCDVTDESHVSRAAAVAASRQ